MSTSKHDKAGDKLIEKVVFINRTAKVVKGGRSFSFSAICVVGDGKGKVGHGLGKANQVPDAIRKGIENASKAMQKVAITETSIPHEIDGKFGAGKVMLKPASAGTGVIAGGAVRAVLEAAGVHNMMTKCLGSNNPHNLGKATINGLLRLKSAEQLAARPGKTVAEKVGVYLEITSGVIDKSILMALCGKRCLVLTNGGMIEHSMKRIGDYVEKSGIDLSVSVVDGIT